MGTINWIDLLLVAIILLALWSGWQRGFLYGALGLLSWVGSFVAGYFLYPYAETFLENSFSVFGLWVRPVAFIIIVILARIILNLLSGFFIREAGASMQESVVNKWLGIVPGFANGILQAIVVSALLLTIPVQNKVSDKTRESNLANQFAPPAFWLTQKLAPIFSEPLRNALPKPVNGQSDKELVTLPFKLARVTVREDLESILLQLVNRERKKEGLKPVLADLEMQLVARAHSKDMFARGYFAHVNPDGADPFDRMHTAGVKFRTAGENLALAQTIEQAHDGLMKSPGHRANILQPQFGRLGIGILDGGFYGLMVTQNFRN